MEDVTKNGVSPIRGIRNEDLSELDKKYQKNRNYQQVRESGLPEELQMDIFNRRQDLNNQTYEIEHGRSNNPQMIDWNIHESDLRMGKSSYDPGMAVEWDANDIQNNRAYSQSAALKIANGIGKGAVTAATTFLDGTVGIVYGLIAGFADGKLSSFWDNDFGKAMSDIQEWSEEAMPNYSTTEEDQLPWYLKLGYANFWGDHVLKNIGFTAGAIASGMVGTGAINYALKGGKLLAQTAKASKTLESIFGATAVKNSAQGITAIRNAGVDISGFTAQAIGSTLGALTESSIEARNNSNDWYKAQLAPIQDEYNRKMAAYDEMIKNNPSLAGSINKLKEQEEVKFNDTVIRLNQDRTKMGNLDFALNMPILMAENFLVWGKAYSSGFTSNKIISNKGVRGLINYTLEKPGSAAWGAVKSASYEGSQEMLQKQSSEFAGDYYSRDVQYFRKTGKDRASSEKIDDMIKSFGESLNKSWGDVNSWEEFAIGAFTGVVGIPGFRRVKNSDGTTSYKFAMHGNPWYEHSQEMEEYNKNKPLVDQLNRIVQNPTFVSGYQSLVRDGVLQNDMNTALLNNDEFAYRNAEFARVANAVIAFDRAGKLGDLQQMVTASEDYSDSGLDSIIRNTTYKEEDGSLSGPWAKYASTDGNGNIVSRFGSEQEKKDMIDKLKKANTSLTNTIAQYRDVKDYYQARLGNKINDEQLGELTWMNIQLEDWYNRFNQMADKIKPALDSYSQYTDALYNQINDRPIFADDQISVMDRDQMQKNNNDLAKLKFFNDVYKQLYKENSKAKAIFLSQNPEYSKSLLESVEYLHSIGAISSQEYDEYSRTIKDMQKVGDAVKTFQDKLDSYLKDPSKLASDDANADVQSAAEHQAIDDAETERVINSKTAGQMATENPDFDESILDNPNISDAAKDKIRDAQDIRDTYNDINTMIDDSELSDLEKEIARQAVFSMAYSANTGEDFDAPTSEELQDILKEFNLDNDVSADEVDFEDLEASLKEILDKASENRKEKERITPRRKRRRRGNTQTIGSDSETGKDPTEKLPPANNRRPQPPLPPRTLETPPSDGYAVGSEIPTFNGDIDVMKQEEDGVKTPDSLPGDADGMHQYYKSNTTQYVTYSIRAARQTPIGVNEKYYDILNKDNPKKALYEAIYKKLEELQAFDHLNAGLIKAGTKVKIATSKSLNAQIGTMVPLIMVENPEAPGTYLCVGDMISSIDDYSKFPNYDVFLNKVQSTLQSSDEDIEFSNVELTTNKVLKGRPLYSPLDEKYTLNKIANNGNFLIGVTTYTTGRIIVDSTETGIGNSALEKKVQFPKTFSPGQPFLLVGDKHNGYQCVPISLPKFNREEASNYALGKEALSVLSEMNDIYRMSLSEIKLLEHDFITNFNFQKFMISKNSAGNMQIAFKMLNDDDFTVLQLPKEQKDSNTFDKLISDFLEKNKVGYNVEISLTNTNHQVQGVPYNKAVGEMATTNIVPGALHLINNFPIFEFMDDKGNLQSPTTPPGMPAGNRDAVNTSTEEALKIAKADAAIKIIEEFQNMVDRSTLPEYYTIKSKDPNKPARRAERVHTVKPDNSDPNFKSKKGENIIKNNSERAKLVGTEIDSIVRQFFEVVKPYSTTRYGDITYNSTLIPKRTFWSLINQLKTLHKYFKDNNETVYANNLVLSRIIDGVHVAGEIDILTKDDKGNIRIYDLKTSKYDFSKLNIKMPFQLEPTIVDYSRQLNFYADMIEDTFHIPINDLAIIPIKLSFDRFDAIKPEEPVKFAKLLPNIKIERDRNSTRWCIADYKRRNGITTTGTPSSASTVTNTQSVVPDNTVSTGSTGTITDGNIEFNIEDLPDIGDFSAEDIELDFNNMPGINPSDKNPPFAGFIPANSTPGVPMTDVEIQNAVNNPIEMEFQQLQLDSSNHRGYNITPKKATIIDKHDRKIVILNLKGKYVPFYCSTGKGGKKTVQSGKWYPFFGIGNDGWMNKGTEEAINDYYGSDTLKKASQLLDTKYGNVTNINTIAKVSANDDNVVDNFINKDIKPTSNNLETTLKTVNTNINDLLVFLESKIYKYTPYYYASYKYGDKRAVITLDDKNAIDATVQVSEDAKGHAVITLSGKEKRAGRVIDNNQISIPLQGGIRIINFIKSNHHWYATLDDGNLVNITEDLIDSILLRTSQQPTTQQEEFETDESETGIDELKDSDSNSDDIIETVPEIIEHSDDHKIDIIIQGTATSTPISGTDSVKDSSSIMTPETFDRDSTINDLYGNTALEELDDNMDIIDMLSDNNIQELSKKKSNKKTKAWWKEFINEVRNSNMSEDEINDIFNDNTKFSLVENEDVETWTDETRAVELKHLRNILPNATRRDVLKIVNTLEKVAGKGRPKAWGSYYNGLITLYKYAERGTAYHEAFHKVFDLGFDEEEKSKILELARQQFPNAITELQLEEALADSFRDYCILKEKTGLLDGIAKFFKELWNMITNMFNSRDSLDAIYSRIYKGQYKDRIAQNSKKKTNKVRYESATEYEKEYNDILSKAPRDSKGRLLAPNGKPSNLTERQYAQVRTKAFKKWFGDWENDPENSSKVLDENGEPLVLYHGGARNINVFRHSSEDDSNTGHGYYTDPNTGEKIPFDSNRTIFFSDNKYVGMSYAHTVASQALRELRFKTENLIESFASGKATYSRGDFKTIDDFYSFLDIISEYNPRFSKLKDHIKDLHSKKERLPENHVKVARQLFIELRDTLDDLKDMQNLNASEHLMTNDYGRNIINRYNSDTGIQALKNGEIPKEIAKEWELYIKIQNARDKLGLVKIGTFEEAFLTLGSGNSYDDYYAIQYDGKNLKFNDTPIAELSNDEIKSFLDNALIVNKQSDEVQKNRIKHLDKKSQLYGVFLNIRNPLAHDYEGTHQGRGYKQNEKYSFGYVAARQVNKAIKEGNDGVIYKNIYDPYLADNYGVFNSNQIKSATDNIGTFDDNNPDIKYSLVDKSNNKSKLWRYIDSNIKNNLADMSQAFADPTTRERRWMELTDNQKSRILECMGVTI